MGIVSSLRMLKSAFGRGVFPHQMSWILDLPGRGLIMSAKTVATRLPVAQDARVLEVGAGSGYYSIEAAKRVPEGELAVLDIQQGMLDKTAARLSEAGISNFSTHLSDGELLPFDDASFDAIFLVTVFGEIEAQNSFLDEARRVLKDGGYLSITEHHPDPDFEPAAAIASLVEQHGFDTAEKLGWRWAYTLNAVKRGAAERA